MPVKLFYIFANEITPAHDVASDMVEAGLKSVVMVQRGRTGGCPYVTSVLMLNGN